MNATYWIEKLGLVRHPEGGYYAEIYRSDESIPAGALAARYEGPRVAGTAIYFLLKAGEPSHLHRLKSDELWHYYAGDPVTIHLIDERGEASRKVLGPDYENGQAFMQVIPRHNWFGASLDETTLPPNAGRQGYVLIGCTVAPGFDFNDFELGNREALLQQYPQYAALIHSLT